MSDPVKHSTRQVLNASVVHVFDGETYLSLVLLIIDNDNRLISVEIDNKAEYDLASWI